VELADPDPALDAEAATLEALLEAEAMTELTEPESEDTRDETEADLEEAVSLAPLPKMVDEP